MAGRRCSVRPKNNRKPTKPTRIINYKNRPLHDALKSYEGLNDKYAHEVIDHAIAYANGHVHTNGLENFWSLLKRTIKGTYVHCEAFHLFRYLDEQAYRFNERSKNDAGRFIGAMSGITNRRLTYEALTGKTA